MNFSEWLKANDYDEAQLSPAQRKHLEAAWKAETQPSHPPPPPEEKKDPASSFDETMRAIEAENERVEAIRDATAQAALEATGNREKVRQIREVCDAAIADKKTTVKDFQLNMLRLVRFASPMVLTPKEQPLTSEVLEAAMCAAGGLESIEKHYDARTLEHAHKQFRRGIGLSTAIIICARQNGYRGHDFKSDWFHALKIAFRSNDGGDGFSPYAAVTGPSTYSLPNIFSNVANKFLRVGFEAVDDTWRRISAIRSFNDFKTATTLALTGSLLYKKLPPSGELKHGTIGEQTYTNKADTYGVILGIDRQSLINDDLGALTAAGRRMGRGGALALNNLFWTVFLNNSSFFTAGNANVLTGTTAGTTNSVFGLEGLANADRVFRLQTDPDGLPLGTMAKILLMPPGSRIAGLNAMNSTTVVSTTTANTPIPDQNAFAGAFNVESSPYMANSAYTGNSATAWYLRADPNDMPVIEVGFLNGQQTPTVETEAAEFDHLGIALRGYYDVGVALQEYRGGVRAAGA